LSSPGVNETDAERVTIRVGETHAVSGLWARPAEARACLVLAHGAGAGMTHPSLEAIAADLFASGIASLRYQFPFMEQGTKRPDPPPVAQAAVRAAVAEAARLAPDLALFAGGRSFGGRMTSQAQAASPLPHVRGLVFLAFPLHPAKRPSDERGRHLFDVHIPMLFLQGTRDALAEPALLQPLCDELGARATLKLLDGADHAFHVLARSGRTDAEVRREAIEAITVWMERAITAAAVSSS
jgi:hypothetical protein